MGAWPKRLVLLVTLLPLCALARGGGGQHYSGGTRSSGGFSGSHSSSGWTPHSSGGYGYSTGGGGDGDANGAICCLLFLLLVIYLVYRFRKQRDVADVRGSFQQAEGRQRVIPVPMDQDALALRLKRADPSFELLAFLDKAEAIFRKLQSAWFERNLVPLRPFLSDATYERFRVQLQLLAAQGVRNALADLEVHSVRWIGLDQNPSYDTAHVRIRASLKDTDVPSSMTDADALRAAQRTEAKPFTEVWSFVRKPNVGTRPGQDALAGKCPNCGAPFSGGASNTCSYCKVIVNSGHYDWVLAEITQGSEAETVSASPSGLEEVRVGDPALSLEVLEDRASLIFFKWIEAQSLGQAQALAKLATPSSVQALAAELESLKSAGKRRVFLECAVGAVVTRAFEQDAATQRAHIEIRWSARAGVTSERARASQFPTVSQRSMLSLVRGAGVPSSAQTGMATFRCPQCHAALTSSVSPACDYCQTPLSDGDRDWVFESLVPVDRWRTSGLQAPPSGAPAAEPVDRAERERLVYLLAAMAAADGRVDGQERRMLAELARRWEISWANVELALEAPAPLFDNLLPGPGPHGEAFLKALLEMARADGKVDRSEQRLLDRAAARLGLTGKLHEWMERP